MQTIQEALEPSTEKLVFYDIDSTIGISERTGIEDEFEIVTFQFVDLNDVVMQCKANSYQELFNLLNKFINIIEIRLYSYSRLKKFKYKILRLYYSFFKHFSQIERIEYRVVSRKCLNHPINSPSSSVKYSVEVVLKIQNSRFVILSENPVSPIGYGCLFDFYENMLEIHKALDRRILHHSNDELHNGFRLAIVT